MSVDYLERRPEWSGPSVWRLGDVLAQLLGQYALAAETCSLPESQTAGSQAAVCGEAALFSTADLPAIAATAY
jgi:hypothetical protein